MAVVVRLTSTGKRGERRFRVVVKEKRSKRDGKAIEILGWYHKRANESQKKINKERYDYWLSKGAKPSPTVDKLMKS